MDNASAGSGFAGRAMRAVASPDVLERLTEAGFLASECGLHAAAARIFNGLVQIKPSNPSPLIALAMVQARRGDAGAAIEQLQQIAERFADSEMAKAMLGTLFVHTGRPGALPLFEQVLATRADAAAVGVVDCCIELARTQAKGLEPGYPPLTGHASF
jgi:predicted Zn-dependent protease